MMRAFFDPVGCLRRSVPATILCGTGIRTGPNDYVYQLQHRVASILLGPGAPPTPDHRRPRHPPTCAVPVQHHDRMASQGHCSEHEPVATVSASVSLLEIQPNLSAFLVRRDAPASILFGP